MQLIHPEALERLKKKFSGLFDPVDPRNPPKDAPPELKKWATDVTTVIVMVMGYTGITEYQKLRSEPIVVPKEFPPAMHDMYVGKQKSGRSVQIAMRSLMGGWYALAFGGMFYGIEAVSAIARDEEDLSNTALAGLLTGSFYGALLPGNLAFRASRSMFGGAVGIAAGAAVGYLSYNLTNKLQEQHENSKGCQPVSRHEGDV